MQVMYVWYYPYTSYCNVGPGSSRKPCKSRYEGSAPYSEPETVALRDFLRDTLGGGKPLQGEGDGQIALYLDYHTYGQLWMYPYGYVEWPGEKRRKARPGDRHFNLEHRELMVSKYVTRGSCSNNNMLRGHSKWFAQVHNNVSHSRARAHSLWIY